MKLSSPSSLGLAQSDVADFHIKFGCHLASKPSVPPPNEVELGLRLIREEFCEVMLAAGSPVEVHPSQAVPCWQPEAKDLPAIAQELADLIYVTLGMANRLGISLSEVWDEIQSANMRKERSKDSGGKIRKPKDFVPADVKSVIERQMAAG